MSDLHSRISTSVKLTLDGKHKLFIHDGGCTINIFNGPNAMVQASFDLADLDGLATLFARAVDEWRRAKAVEAQANEPIPDNTF